MVKCCVFVDTEIGTVRHSRIETGVRPVRDGGRDSLPAASTTPHTDLAVISSQRTKSPTKASFPPTVIWVTNPGRLVFRNFSSLPWRRTRKTRVYRYQNIHFPNTSRVASPSRTLLLLCKAKHRPSVNSEETIES
jgi:hypothetical protein